MNKCLFFAFTFFSLLTVKAGEGTALWDSGRELGGWRAFGNGMLAAQVQSGDVKLAVDWMETAFGVGAVYENTLPDLTAVKHLTVEARASDANGTILAPEWVAGEKGYRVSPDRQATLTAEWETYTFEVPGDFARLAGNEGTITALRLLFVNPDKPGRADVFYRNVRLDP